MNLFATMDTSGGAMQAERMRAEVVAANMANAETTRTASGGPYRRQHVVFAANRAEQGFLNSYADAAGTLTDSGLAASGLAAGPSFTSSLAAAALPTLRLPGSGAVAPGVHIAQVVEDPAPPLERYDPGHPDARPTATSPIRILIPSQRWWT